MRSLDPSDWRRRSPSLLSVSLLTTYPCLPPHPTQSLWGLVLKVPSVHEKSIARYSSALRSFLRSYAENYLTVQSIDAEFHPGHAPPIWPCCVELTLFAHAHDTRRPPRVTNAPPPAQLPLSATKLSIHRPGSFESPPVRCLGTASTVGTWSTTDGRIPRFALPRPLPTPRSQPRAPFPVHAQTLGPRLW